MEKCPRNVHTAVQMSIFDNMSAKCPLNVRKKCPHVQNRAAQSTILANVYGGFVQMSGQMTKCPHNVQMSTFRDKNVAKMSTRMSPNHPATYSRSAARFVRWPVDIADEERLHVSRCPQLSPRHHVLPVYSVDWRRSIASKALCRGSCALFQCPNVKGP